MGYNIDLSKISLEKYATKLQTAYLPPSRKILLNDIKNRFQAIQNQGIENVEQLRTALKNKKKVSEFAGQSKIDEDYLIILIREINSSIPKPNKWKDFPEISSDLVDKLEKLGIKDTLHLYNRIQTSSERKKLETETGIDKAEILKLAQFTDLSRVRWVNHTFAFMLYEKGYKTVEKLANADAVELHKAIAEINVEYGFYRGTIGLNDIRICIEAAKEIPQDIEY